MVGKEHIKTMENSQNVPIKSKLLAREYFKNKENTEEIQERKMVIHKELEFIGNNLKIEYDA
jgi:hypothetical protein